MLTHKHHSPSHMAFLNLTVSSSTLITLLLLLNRWAMIVAYESRETPPPSPIPEDASGIAQQQHSSTTFKPGVAIVVGALTLVFSLTFLLLLYIKHCSGGGNIMDSSGGGISAVPPLSAARKNSGIDRSVVESLPIFRFGSLRGQKDGLDCAVCLTKFEDAEVLRLLPKCKHAFHVECVDTWLDAHSTCPLCRYRVDPEDILLLVEDAKNASRQNTRNKEEGECVDLERGRNEVAVAVAVAVAECGRRHSSVGEREWERERRKTASFRRSLDSASATSRRKNENENENENGGAVGIGIGCLVRPRKDGMLLTQDTGADRERDRTSVERRLEHRIIVSPSPHVNSGLHRHQRWSDVQPCDLLYLTSEMIISESRRVVHHHHHRTNTTNHDSWSGRGIINSRSVSEITGLSRFPSNNNNNNGTGREEGLVSRWLAWISHSHTQPAVR